MGQIKVIHKDGTDVRRRPFLRLVYSQLFAAFPNAFQDNLFLFYKLVFFHGGDARKLVFHAKLFVFEYAQLMIGKPDNPLQFG